MFKVNKYYSASAALHFAVVLFFIIEIGLPARNTIGTDISGAYQVDLVADIPSASRAFTSDTKNKDADQKESGEIPISLSDVAQEETLREEKQDSTSAETEDSSDKIQETYHDTAQVAKNEHAFSDNPSPVVMGHGSIGNPQGESSDAVLLWKLQVKAMVNGIWKAPPEIPLAEMTLKTTYLLRVSRDGDLLGKRLLVSSGNSPFDRSIEMALSNVRKLPPPPLILITDHDSAEVTMSFSPPRGAR